MKKSMTHFKNKTYSFVALMGFVLMTACHVFETPTPPTPQNIVQTAQGISEFSILVQAIQRAGLAEALAGPGPFTVFGPTNQAFADAGITSVNDIPVDQLARILQYHVISGRRTVSEIPSGTLPTLLANESLTFQNNIDVITINGSAGLVLRNIVATNGVIHGIDEVLMPPAAPDPDPEDNTLVDVLEENGFNTLLAAATAAGLAETLNDGGPFTIFAPTDAAFTAFLEDNNLTAEEILASPMLADILSYHVVAGEVPSSAVEAGSVTNLTDNPFFVSVDPDGGIFINGNAQITAVDLMADNGIIHTIDYVITSPTQSIAEIAVGFTTGDEPQFTQLVAALTRAGLVDAVSGGFEDNLTVFAPTDAAFEALYEALEVDGVDDIPLELLTDVLLYHVVPARAFSQDLREGAELPTLLEDQILTVNLADLEINESGLIPGLLNVHATNGVIHVIDSVLLPPAED
ncbi:fasciclin domain-containing protein [Pararhodonellum marinum]|uniref:fasciclin domain-containing protein n=1 Tax=Pararhodonellum marinum TaxID=2755358 RepID=UPI00188DFBB3|nr:fasciclin domain-containing protein [Pararhodonellum marinum]